MRRRIPAKDFRLGCVERWAGVSLFMEHGTYQVRRHPDFGHVVTGAPTLRRARTIAARLRRGMTLTDAQSGAEE
jgi:hypothetical protein